MFYRQNAAAFRRRWRSAICTGRRVRHHPEHSHGQVRGAPIAVLAAPVARPASSAPLTAREQEVAVLVGHGLTNRQIAERLVIALRTADNHVQHIFDKLGLSSRAQVAAWVAVRGLLALPPGTAPAA
jgi:DNA-binding NarL/FixJ family response regulator